MKKMIGEFDGVREIVYVADPVSYELLFLNKSGLEAYGYERPEQVVGRKCYEVLQGYDMPCVFCNNGRLCRDRYVEWEHENPVTGKNYRLKDKLIRWEGRDVRLEIADDFTEFGEIRTEREKIVMECIKRMYSSLETDVAINNTLETLGNYLGGERTYIFHVRGKMMDNIYEWCAEGVSSEMDTLQNLPVSMIERWLPYFYQNECVIIRDLETIRETAPEEYDILKPQNIRSLITVPLIEKGNLVGYFGVDNPSDDNLYEISNTLKMLAYFFQSLLERKAREDYLKKIGFTDEMTGALNRNAYIRDTMLDSTTELTSAGGFFIDINGLKKTNDLYGHEAGDRLILQIYQLIRSVVGRYPVYRLGGDEFIVLCPNVEEEELSEMEKRLHEELGGKNGCAAAVGACFLENPGDLSVILKEADEKMYADKKRFYSQK